MTTEAPTFLKQFFNSPFYGTYFDKILLTILNVSSILVLEQMFAFTKGVHIMKDYKEKLIKLLEKLTAGQIEYIYHLTCKLFGHTAD